MGGESPAPCRKLGNLVLQNSMASFNQSFHSEVLSKAPDTGQLWKNIYSNVFTWLDSISTESWVLSLGHVSFSSLSLLKSSNLMLRLQIRLGPLAIFLIKLFPVLPQRALIPGPSLQAEYPRRWYSVLLFYWGIYLWWPQNTGLALVSLA